MRQLKNAYSLSTLTETLHHSGLLHGSDGTTQKLDGGKEASIDSAIGVESYSS